MKFGNNIPDMTFVSSSFSYDDVVFCDPSLREAPVEFDPAKKSPTTAAAPAKSTRYDRAWLRNILQSAGLPLEAYKFETLQRRKSACLRALGVGSIAEARLLLCKRPDRLESALSALLIGVTDFFRDPQVFAALHGLIKKSDRPLRVWSAGCSNGAELYSVAMLLDQAGLAEGSNLLGTDCRAEAIAQASAAFYDGQAAAAIPPHLRHAYCEMQGARFRLIDRLRRSVHFRQSNMLAAPEPGEWDLILCRNVAIYLQPSAVRKLWPALEAALAPAGLMMLGKAERPTVATRLRPAGPMLWRKREAT